MFREHELAPRSRDERVVARTRRPAPPAPTDLALALQRGAGNQATGRVLSRYTAPNEAKFKQAKSQVELITELIAAVMSAHKGTFEAKAADRPALVKPLEDQLALYAATVQKWEAAPDAATEGPLIPQALGELKRAVELRTALFAALGGGNAEKGKEAVDRVLKAREASRKTVEDQKNQEAAFKAQKLADEKTKTELAAVFVPAAAGPAYARPVDAEIPRFAEHVRLSHPAFGGLSEPQLRSELCPLYLLSATQLARVESFAGGTLTGWRVQGVPASRAEALAPIDRWLVPTHSPKLLFELGGEIYADWVVNPPKRGHGFAVSKIMEIWSFLNQMGEGPFMSVTERDGKRAYEYKPKGEWPVSKIVTRDSNKVLITCFDVRS